LELKPEKGGAFDIFSREFSWLVWSDNHIKSPLQIDTEVELKRINTS